VGQWASGPVGQWARETLIEDTRAGGHVDWTNRIAQRETGDRMIGWGVLR